MAIWATYSLNAEVVNEFTFASHFHEGAKMQTMRSALFQLNNVKYCCMSLFPPTVQLGKAYSLGFFLIVVLAWST